MQSRQKKEITKNVLIFLKIWCVTLFFFSASYFFFNVIYLNRLERSVADDYKDIYSVSRRFSSYYNNTDSIYLEKGDYYRNGVDIIVNHDTNVKILSVGIKKLRTELDKLIGDNLWTIAVFQNPTQYVHFYPLRKSYDIFYKGMNNEDAIERIVNKESLKATYQSFYGCNLKLTEEYKEEKTNQIIRSLYYPIYNKKHLDSLLIIDIKASLLMDKVRAFNNENITVININEKENIYNKSMPLPCSEEEQIIFSISITNVVKKVILPTLLFSSVVFLLLLNFNRRKYALQYDRMTGFYRRDFYEDRLNKMKSHSLLLIDIDHFKHINDTYGHKKGDEVIQEVAQRILNVVRKKDAVIRWGGEEFIISFQSLTYTELEEKAEQIRAAIEKESIKKLKVTISIGGVVEENILFSEAYKLVDEALYQSKESGRNRVTMAEPK